MGLSAGKRITRAAASSESSFFLSPQHALHRQYEALRAYFVEELSCKDAAERFGYSAGAFRVLCHQFRHDPDKREFFRTPRHGPQNAPARDAVRELAVAMRERNMSVDDIQRKFTIHVRTMKKRLRRSLEAVADRCRRHRHGDVTEQQRTLNAKLRGQYEYYGRPTNFRSLWKFYRKVRAIWKTWLNRRTRGRTLTWERYAEFLQSCSLAVPRITRPWAGAASRT